VKIYKLNTHASSHVIFRSAFLPTRLRFIVVLTGGEAEAQQHLGFMVE
jgi:hypothetical protein